jgi:hypothetical protein
MIDEKQYEQFMQRIEFLEEQYRHLSEYLNHTGEYKHLEARLNPHLDEELK